MIRSFVAVLALSVLAATITVARPIPRGELPTIESPARTPADAPAHHAKAVTDTVWVYGGPDTYQGRFETEGGLADWQGWTHEDLTTGDEGVNHWHVSDYWAEYVDDKGIGNHALYCGDETSGETFRACEQFKESLYGYESGGTAPVPSLAEECTANEDLTTWTCKLREGVKFHNGADFDASDVVASFALQWDMESPLRVGRTGVFEYWPSMIGGGYLNPPPPAEE